MTTVMLPGRLGASQRALLGFQGTTRNEVPEGMTQSPTRNNPTRRSMLDDRREARAEVRQVPVTGKVTRRPMLPTPDRPMGVVRRIPFSDDTLALTYNETHGA